MLVFSKEYKNDRFNVVFKCEKKGFNGKKKKKNILQKKNNKLS